MLRPLLLLTTLAGWVRAASFEEAHAAYAAGDYAKAASAYDDLIAQEGPSAARYYNLGNARFRLNEYGPAILAYERAAVLSPRDGNLRTNLKAARDAAKSPATAPEPAWWEVPLHGLSLQEWSWLTVFFTGAAAVLVCTAAFSRKQRARALFSAGMALLLAALGGTTLFLRRGERSRAIVISASPKLLISPFESAESTGALSTGAIVHVEKTENGWRYVRTLSGGRKGWLPEKDAAMLLPE